MAIRMRMLSLVLLVLLTSPVLNNGGPIDCINSVVSALNPCKDFLNGGLPLPTAECCGRVKSLIGVAADVVCQCLKENPIGGVIPSLANLIPGLCDLVPFLPFINCLIPSESSSEIPMQ
ncbi:non-specific lipid-transfer protein-like [Olea europaea var. sylvestris]|uniref:non-specific lipid-transfer protein-like n=1 Tax=Olea europaea var. sylvestris TaxID=158386 RepID=UPI000C1D0814|nr:non-specific lipid-transfer protein-like [Olea europaea var. sylvestris]